MKQINMTCLVDMPEDLFEASALAVKVKPAWEALLSALKEAKVPCSTKIDVIVLDGPRKRSGKAAPNKPQVLPVADPPSGDDYDVRPFGVTGALHT